MTLTLDEVRKTKFHMARRTGYEVSEVDLFVDRVEASFAQLTEENQSLKQQVEALNQAQAQSRQREERQEPSNEDLRRQQRQEEQRKAEQRQAEERQAEQRQAQQRPTSAENVERIVVSTSAEASPAVVRLVQMATEQSEQLVNEATAEANRKVEEATQKARQITSDAQAKSERVGSEARTNAERVTSEAQSRAADIDRQAGQRRTELFAALEQERDQLQDAVGQLRAFEANYRQTFTGHLKQQLQAVEGLVVEPTSKPALAERQDGGQSQGQRAAQSNTPRLDALLGENQRNN